MLMICPLSFFCKINIKAATLAFCGWRLQTRRPSSFNNYWLVFKSHSLLHGQCSSACLADGDEHYYVWNVIVWVVGNVESEEEKEVSEFKSSNVVHVVDAQTDLLDTNYKLLIVKSNTLFTFHLVNHLISVNELTEGIGCTQSRMYS